MQSPHATSPSPAIEPGALVDLLIINQFFPPDYAATGQLISELAEQLGSESLQVRIFTGQPGYAFQKSSAPPLETVGSVQVKRTRISRLWSQRIRGKIVQGLLFCLRVCWYLLNPKNRPDLLLLTTAPPYLLFVGILARMLGIRYCCLIFDLYPDIVVQLKLLQSNHWLARCWRGLNQLSWRSAEAIIVLSASMQDHLAKYYPGMAAKIHVIHSWADPAWIQPLPKQENWFALEHGLADRFTVLYSGNMGRCHDMQTILDAAILLQAEPIQFVFIGEGAQKQACLERVAHLGLSNCLFLPYQAKEVLPYSLTACDLALVSVKAGMGGLVAPSKLYAHLASAKPIAVIAEPDSYLQVMMAEGNFGTLISNQDSEALAGWIRQLAADPHQLQLLGVNGRHYLLTHYTPSVISQQYLRIFASCLSCFPQLKLDANTLHSLV
jgi:glycosyltransferase involved in cell wall biosynthesis